MGYIAVMIDHSDATRLVLVIHNHQPVGNFDHVFADATDKSYAPFVDLLAEHPAVRVGLHFTGPLLEWLEEHRPSLLSTVAELTKRGQVEILGGGWSEPMLSVLKSRDAIGQMRIMRDECERILGVAPRGMWLAERVWDPDLPRLLRAAEMEYTLLDDTHFRYAGLLDERLTGHWVTEKAGDAVAIFPIDRELRYAIPFHSPDEAIAAIRSAGPGVTVTYGDDGEKFGVWPGTWDWVWGLGWLKSFFERLEDPEQGVELIHPSEQLDRHIATGRVYLPTASYHEMGEWTLSPEAGRRLLDLKGKLADHNLADEAEPFLHGGIWMGFLAKYPEANVLHKRMLRASDKVEAAARDRSEETIADARRALYRGQCNCPYWHGLFGGLYLPHLRHAVYRQIVEAEALVDGDFEGARVEVADLDGDLVDEVAFESAAATVWVSPAEGGQLLALDDRRRRVALGHVLTRRPETYHQDLLEAAGQQKEGGDDSPHSIHDAHKSKVPDLEQRLVYDPHVRRILVDALLPVGTDLASLEGDSTPLLADLSNLRYDILDSESEMSWARVALRGEAALRGDSDGRLRIIKRLRLVAPARLEVEWEIILDGPSAVEGIFAVESALALVPGDDQFMLTLDAPSVVGDEARRSPEEAGVWAEVNQLTAGSSLGGAGVIVTPSTTARVAWFPQRTVSQSEDGAELVYQGTVLVVGWPVTLTPGAVETRGLTLTLR